MNFNQLDLPRFLPETEFNPYKAVEKLKVVQAASMQVRLLEEELVSPLLQRTGKKLIVSTGFEKPVRFR